MAEPLSPTIQRLRCLSKPRQIWPKGTRQPLTKELAQRFCDLISTSLVSTSRLLADHPDLPPFKTLETWKAKFPWFNSMWKKARQDQGEFLMQHCLDLAIAAEPKTAHVVRVKFDVYRFLASKLHPEVYGDKSFQPQQQTTVNVGISISPERLTEIRGKLNHTRNAFIANHHASTTKDESRTLLTNGKRVQHEHANGDHDQPASSQPGPST